MKCLIIAAGRGTRLAGRGDSKPLIPLLGVSLVERVILTARESGLTDFHVVTGYNGEKVREHLNRFSQRRKVTISHITNEEWEKENGLSVLKARERLHENFVLLMGDHIFDGAILAKLTNEEIADDEVMLAVDHNIENNKFVNADDVTRVLARDNRILDIGKHIESYNSYDTGMFLCSPAIFTAIAESLRNGDSTLSGGMRVLAGKGKARALDIGDSYWIDVDDDDTFKKAEGKLLSALKKPSDGPVSRYLNRPISVRVTRPLLRTGITPNQVSAFSFMLSMTGALFFFLGGYANLVMGGILAQLSSVIDGCDGEIARLKFRATEFGGWFDAVLDRYADMFLLAGLIWHLHSSRGGLLPLSIGLLAITGTFMNSYTADKYDGFMKKRIRAGRAYFRMGRDVRILVILVGALANRPLLPLLAIAVLTNVENIARVVLLYRNQEAIGRLRR